MFADRRHTWGSSKTYGTSFSPGRWDENTGKMPVPHLLLLERLNHAHEKASTLSRARPPTTVSERDDRLHTIVGCHAVNGAFSVIVWRVRDPCCKEKLCNTPEPRVGMQSQLVGSPRDVPTVINPSLREKNSALVCQDRYAKIQAG